MGDSFEIVMAKALIDADPCIFGHHKSHIELMMPRVRAQIAALAEAGYAVVRTEVLDQLVDTPPTTGRTKAPITAAEKDQDNE